MTQDAIGGFRLLEGVGPGVHQCPDGLVTVEVGNRDFQLVGRGFSSDTRHPNPVLAHLMQLDRREVRDTVRCDVSTRVTHFVDELLGD